MAHLSIVLSRLFDNIAIPYDLLLIAYPSRQRIDDYVKIGEIYAGAIDNRTVAACVLVQRSQSIVEIANIAVEPSIQGQGIGKLMIGQAALRAEEMGADRLVVGTGNSSLAQLAFYQKCGFRMVGVERDYFLRHYPEAITENGIACRDRIQLEREI